MSGETRRFWARFYMDPDDKDPSDSRPMLPTSAPPWGCSGSGYTSDGRGQAIVCALVDAPSEGAAVDIINDQWPAVDIDIDEVAGDWMPEPTRWACIHKTVRERADGVVR